MDMKITFTEPHIAKDGIVIVASFQDKVLPKASQAVDVLMQGELTRILSASSFTGKRGEIFSIPSPQGLDSVKQLVVLGLGNPADLTRLELEKTGGKLASCFCKTPHQTAYIHIPHIECPSVQDEHAAALLANGFLLKSWTFGKYKTKQKPDEKSALESVIVSSVNPSASIPAFDDMEKISKAVFLTRTLVSEPANVINPETLAHMALELKHHGVDVEVFGEVELHQMGLHALLGVGQGSQHESQLVVLQWRGGAPEEAPIAIVGKGVTFDSGGISIKPSANMEEMKGDMAGAGAVIGFLQACAMRKARVNIVGVVGLVENMPSGSAQRPGDIVTSLSGQTIEVINTDAEGRLVLADALWYTQDRFKPKFMIDLATLTGAIVVALGHERAGLFSNDESLAQDLMKAGIETGEKLWQFPVDPAYDKEIDSDIADVKNTGSGRGAGSITAAKFLQRFVNETPWAHIDIAGVEWDKKDRSLSRKGATGFGVRLLDHFIRSRYETH